MKKPLQVEVDAAESVAAHRAFEVFVEVLTAELTKLGCDNLVETMGRREHVHTACFFTEDGVARGVVRYKFVFDDRHFAVTAVLATSDLVRFPAP